MGLFGRSASNSEDAAPQNGPQGAGLGVGEAGLAPPSLTRYLPNGPLVSPIAENHHSGRRGEKVGEQEKARAYPRLF
jgi:hypothetical protein